MWLWAVKLQFLLIYENMLKSILTARSECKAKQENKASYNKDYIVPDLIDFFGDGWKEIKRQIEKRNIHNCKKYYIVKIGLLLVISENFLSTTRKNNVLVICISY